MNKSTETSPSEIESLKTHRVVLVSRIERDERELAKIEMELFRIGVGFLHVTAKDNTK